MSSNTTIYVQPGVQINVWVSAVNTVGIEIGGGMADVGGAYLTPEKVDELIRALGLARVEISKEKPQS
jgi:hypothetical protein